MDRIPWIPLKAAIGLRISYIGYAVLDFAVGGIEVTNKGIIIMIEDSSMGTEYGLLEMNVIKDCWENLFLNGHPGEMAFKSTVPQALIKTWDTAFVICKRIRAPGEPLQVKARLTQRSPISIPPRLSWAQGGKVPVYICNPQLFPVLLPHRLTPRTSRGGTIWFYETRPQERWTWTCEGPARETPPHGGESAEILPGSRKSSLPC